MSYQGYYADSDGNWYRTKEDRRNRVNVASTRIQRDAEASGYFEDGTACKTTPEWKQFELGWLDELDGKKCQGPNAPDFIVETLPTREALKEQILESRRPKENDMAERTQDWDVRTGWEKRIKVDLGSNGPNHPRWSDWTYKERDIVARKVHESQSISQLHGARSKRMKEWAKEHEPIMIGFARDGGPMPDWAHADYRESGVPEYVKVVWNQPDIAGPGEWVYDPPGPWEDKGEEPAWSAVPDDAVMPSMPREIAAADEPFVPDPDVVDTVRIYWQLNLSKKGKGENWRRVLIALGVEEDDGVGPYTAAEARESEKIWSGWEPIREELERLESSSAAADHDTASSPQATEPADAPPPSPPAEDHDWVPVAEDDVLVAANRYRAAVGLPPVEKSQAEKLHDALVTVDEQPDAEVRVFNPETETWDEIKGVVRHTEKDPPQYRLTPMADYGPEPPKKGATGWYTRREEWLPDWYLDLPELTFEEGEAQGMTSRASVAPMNYIFHKKGVGILGRQAKSPEREDLPIWTKAQAAAYYTSIGIKMRSVTWLDGHLMTRKGYSTTGDNRGEPIARAADEEYEKAHQTVAAPNDIAAAIAAGDWALVAKLAAEKAGE